MKFMKFLLKLGGALLAIAGALYMIVTYLDQIKALLVGLCNRASDCCCKLKDDEYADYAD